ncbi:HNH endonuclease signature motif containing protein [Nocardia heshunensis]
MHSKGETFETCGIIQLMTAVQSVSATLHDNGLSTLTDSEFTDFLRQFETCKRQLSALDSRLILEISDRGLPQSTGAGDLIAFLRQTLSLSRYDAAGRVKIARACAGLLDASGHPRADTLSATAEAYEAGAISRDHVRNMVDVMTHLPVDIAPEAYAETELHLLEHCLTGHPEDLPKMGREILARLDLDGTVISDADRRRRRGLTLGRPGVDGMTHVDGWLTPELRAYLDAFFAKYARPGMCNIDDLEPLALSVAAFDSKLLDAAARRDRRDAGQRTHDALYALLQPAAPAVAGKRATATGKPAISPAATGAPAGPATTTDGSATPATAVTERTAPAMVSGIPAAPAAVSGMPGGPVAVSGMPGAPAAVSGIPGGPAAVLGQSTTPGAAFTEPAAPVAASGHSTGSAVGFDELATGPAAFNESATPGVSFGQHRGLKTQVILTMSLADLERGAGLASTATGGHVSINEALKMAAGTRPVLAVLDPHGIPMFLGKCKRLASPGQRLALIARDKGCTRPGCDAPASMCAVHHVTDWAVGGPTDLSNLALACDHCHALVNDSADGWKTVVMGKDSAFPGRCGWIAPKHVDPTQSAKVNQRHHVAGLVAAAVDSSCQQWGSRVA